MVSPEDLKRMLDDANAKMLAAKKALDEFILAEAAHKAMAKAPVLDSPCPSENEAMASAPVLCSPCPSENGKKKKKRKRIKLPDTSAVVKTCAKPLNEEEIREAELRREKALEACSEFARTFMDEEDAGTVLISFFTLIFQINCEYA